MRRSRTSRSAGLLFLSLVVTACGGSGGDNINSAPCPADHERVGHACLPVTDACGEGETALPGGGCLVAGMSGCATGFTPSGRGGCDPVVGGLCADGSRAVLGSTGCQQVGVPSCPAGFESNGEGGCDPTLPAPPYPAGTIPVIGETLCQPLGDCGTGTWGNITPDATTMFVDQSYTGGGSDGSMAAPYTDVFLAYAFAQEGAQIAIAAGDYPTQLFLGKRVRLVGRCAEMVTLRAPNSFATVVYVFERGAESEVRGVSITGAQNGVLVQDATDVRLEDVHVLDTGQVGIAILDGSSADLQRVRVEQATGAGVIFQGRRLTMRESFVHATRFTVDSQFGRAVQNTCQQTDFSCGTMRLERSVIADNPEFGLYVTGVDTVVTESVIRGTLPAADGSFGRGINVQCDVTAGVACGGFELSRSVIAGNHEVGVIGFGIDLLVTETSVVDTQPQQNTNAGGRGIEVGCHAAAATCGILTLQRSFIADNHHAGVWIAAEPASIVDTVVTRTAEQPSDDQGGWGIRTRCNANGTVCDALEVRGALIAANTAAGIRSDGPDVIVSDTAIRDTRSRATDGRGGYGVEFVCLAPTICPTGLIAGSVLTSNRDAGIRSTGATVTVSHSVVRATGPRDADEHAQAGIAADCFNPTTCGMLTVSQSVVSGSRGRGVSLDSVPATIVDSAIQNTVPQPADDTLGVGVVTTCGSDTGCPLDISGSLLSGNRLAALASFGSAVTVRGSVVRDTLPQQSDGAGGRGINAQCHPSGFPCGTLEVRDSHVEASQEVGIFTEDVSTLLDGVVVTDTEANLDAGGDYGQGVFATCRAPARVCASLEVSSCHVESSVGAGIAARGVTGFVNSSRILGVAPRPFDGLFGYGVQIDGNGAALAFFVQHSEIDGAALAGALFFAAGGGVTSTAISGGRYTIIGTPGQELTLSDNDLDGERRAVIYDAGREPAPAPPPLPTF